MRQRLLALIGVVAIASACLPLSRTAGEQHDFADFAATPEIFLPAASVAVEMAPHWQHPGIAYRLLYVEPTRLSQYAGERWAAPPGVLIERYLERRLAMTGGCRLHLRVDEFAQHFVSSGTSHWLIRAEGRLFPLRGKALLARRAFVIDTPAAAHAAGGVAAAREGMARLARRLADWLAEEDLACTTAETRQSRER